MQLIVCPVCSLIIVQAILILVLIAPLTPPQLHPVVNAYSIVVLLTTCAKALIGAECESRLATATS